MDRGAWQAIVHGVTKNKTQLSEKKSHTLINNQVFYNFSEWEQNSEKQDGKPFKHMRK